MKVLHLNAGNETGGGMYYLLRTLSALSERYPKDQFILGVMEKKELYNRAVQENLSVEWFQASGRLSVPLLLRIINYIKREQITHIHTHGPRANVILNLIRGFISVPWIITVHSNPLIDFSHNKWKRLFYTNLHLPVFKHANKIISVSRSFYPILKNQGVVTAQLTTIANGVNFNRELRQDRKAGILNRKQKGFTKEDFLFVQIGRLEYVKGHERSIKAIALLNQLGYAHVHLIVVGSGTLKSYLHQLVAQLDIGSRVHFVGECSEKEVEEYYALADVTLLTSYSESFPFVLLESARAKKPVITTNVGDIQYLVEHNKSGWVVESNDQIQLVDTMKKAVATKQSPYLQEMGEYFYEFASKHYNLDKCIHSMYEVYTSLTDPLIYSKSNRKCE